MISLTKKIWQFSWGGLMYDPKVLFAYILSYITGTSPTQVQEYDEETLLHKIAHGSSLIRFGDGEAMLMTGRDIHYQKTSTKLNTSLRKIISEYNPNSPYVIGVAAYALQDTDVNLQQKNRLRIWRLFRIFYQRRFNLSMKYYCLVYFYRQGNFETKVAPLLKQKNVICVSNQKVLDTVLQTYLQKYFRTASFVFTPPQNAYEDKTRIMSEIDTHLKKYGHNTCTILLATGPASKVIAYEYAMRGVQALDIGHGMEIIGRDSDYSDRI